MNQDFIEICGNWHEWLKNGVISFFQMALVAVIFVALFMGLVWVICHPKAWLVVIGLLLASWLGSWLVVKLYGTE